MAKAPTKKEDELLPDEAEQRRLLSEARSFASEPRFARVLGAMHVLAAEPPHSLLFEGGTARERASATLYWAALLNCENTGEAGPCLDCPACVQFFSRLHRDLFFFDGSAGNIKIDDIREMRVQLGEAPQQARLRVVVLFEGQAMTDASANALLKSIEEPRPGNVFALTSPQRERLLPTLVSRSWVLTLPWPTDGAFGQMDDAELAQVSDWGRALLNFAGSGKGWMERTARRGGMDAKLAMQLVIFCQNALKDAMSGQAASTPLAGAFARLSPQGRRILNETLAECQDSLVYNVNPSLVADWLATRVFFLFARERSM